MFGSKKKEPEFVQEVKPAEEKPVVNEKKTIISDGITMKGTFEGSDPIEIRGCIEGTVKSTASVYVAKGGKLCGDGFVQDLFVDGLVDGNFECKNLASFNATGEMKGTLTAARLKTDDGASFGGQLLLKKKEAPAPAPENIPSLTIEDAPAEEKPKA